MLARTDASPGAIVLASLVERWIEEVPRWDPLTSEPWSAFATRHRAAEQALQDKVQHLPGCHLQTDATSLQVTLALGGTRTQSRAGLVGVCRAWAVEARRRSAFQFGG